MPYRHLCPPPLHFLSSGKRSRCRKSYAC
jgi:hypothetical protein